MDTDQVLSYESKNVRVSRSAVVVFWLSIAAASMFFLVVPALLTLVGAILVRIRMATRPDLEGRGYGVWALRVSVSAMGLGLFAWMLMPCGCGGSRELPNRSTCSTNLKGIMTSLNVYAADNSDKYPEVAYASYSASLNDARATAASADANEVIKDYYRAPFRQAGSPQAALWQLVLRGDVGPKNFICKSDTFVSAASVTNASGAFFDNFQDGHQLSYSIAYPWRGDGKVGAWWKSTFDSSLPLLSDMAPENGTGTPARDVTSNPLTKLANSTNHNGDGQNVAYADAHVDFVRTPAVGMENDNIFTSSASPSTGPLQFGGIPASKTSPNLMADKAPFDIVMYPIRNESTGGF